MFAAGKTAAVSGAGPDAQFNYVTMLLHGDGTNGAQNNTFLDSSTNNFTITRNGNTTQGSFSPYGSNWSNFFDGTGDYLSLASNAAFAFSSGDFTVEFWMQSDNASSGAADRIYRTGDNNATGNLQILISGTAIRIDSGVSTLLTGSVNVVNSSWHHIAVTRSGTSLKLFVDGTQDGSTVTNSTNFTTQVPQIAYDTAVGSGSEYTGYLSNLRVVKGTAVYTSNFTPSTTPLTAISGTSLLTCQSNRFVDNSTNNFTLTLNGTPSVQRFNPFGASTAYSTSVIGGSGYFDGSGDTLQATAGAVPAIGTSDFTLSGWWYLNELKNYQIFFDFRNGTNVEAVPYLYMGSTGLADYFVDNISHNLSINFRANEWSYVVVSRVSGTTKIFINGAQALSYADSTTYVAGRLNLGFNNSGGTAYYYNGYIADFKLVIGTGTTSGTPTTAPATATSGTQALLSMTNGAIFDNAMMNDLETVGNAQISTSVVKYGTGSMAFDGSGDYLVSAPSPNNILGGGDFTIEFWLYPNNTTSSYRALVSSENYNPSTTGGWSLYQIGDKFELWIVPSNIITSTASITANVWQHVALTRASGTLRLFVNGSSVGTASNSTSLTGQKILIGDNLGSYFYNGYIDDLRITKGYARYTATFTPPTAAFSDTGPY